MADLSRRRLFGLLAGVAAAPMLKGAEPLMHQGVELHYDTFEWPEVSVHQFQRVWYAANDGLVRFTPVAPEDFWIEYGATGGDGLDLIRGAP